MPPILFTARSFLTLVFVAACAVLLHFTFSGAFRLLLPVNSPVNAESLIAISFLLLLIIGVSSAKRELIQEAIPTSRLKANIAPVIVIIGATAWSFSAMLNAPLLYDAYTDVTTAAHQSFSQVLGTFYQHPVSGDFFFRPIGNLTYWIDFRWAGFDPFRWNLWNLGVHILTSLLVYMFARRLSLSPLFATLAGLIFALHGTRPEVASWVGERFDLLSALFALLSLITLIVCLESTKHRIWWYSASIAAFTLAMLSKESAYCLPLLVLCLIPFKPNVGCRAIVRSALLFSIVASIMFLYRYWVLGSIGGYRTAGEGDATILRFNMIRSVRALSFREWAFLFFPINWSADIGIWIKLSVALFVAVLCGVLVCCRPQRKYILASISLTVAASLPVQHLLLLSQDMAGARVLYLPILGVSIFWGFVLQECKGRSHLILLATGLLASQMIVLAHNLSIWRDAAFLSQKTCRLLGAELERTGDRAIVSNLPSTWHGVYFLRNGFAYCVAMNSGASADLVQVKDEVSAAPPHTRIFKWNPKTNRLEGK